MDSVEYLTVDHLSTKDLIRIFLFNVFMDESVQWNDTPCWIWTGLRSKAGYGLMSWQARHEKVHRIVYAWAVEPIPRGRNLGEIDHLCRRTSCCSPLHLEFVTTQVNILRSTSPTAANARKTHCPRGHPLAPRRNGDKWERHCPICAYDLARQRRLANPEASREYVRRYRARNPEKVREMDRKGQNRRRAADREKSRQQYREYYLRHRDKLRAYTREWARRKRQISAERLE